MKKFLGLFMAVLSTIGIASAFHINAAEANTASQFQNVDTKARLKFSYDDETLALNSMQIKFGGQVSKDYFTEGENVEHGVIVTPTELVTLLSPSDHLLTLEKYNLLIENQFALPFTMDEIKTIKIKNENNTEEEVYQYNWVLDAIDKDQNLLPYNYTFVAAMYEKIGDVITLASPKIGSIVSVIDEYYALPDFNPDTNLDTVLKSVRNQFKKYSVDENYLENNIETGKCPFNMNHYLYLHTWNNDNTMQYDIKHAIINNNGKYDFYLEPVYNNVRFIYGKPENFFDWDNNYAETKNIDLNSDISISNYNTFNNVEENTKNYLTHKNNDGKDLFAWVWEYGHDGYFVKVKNNSLCVPQNINRVIYMYTVDNTANWGDNSNNILEQSCELVLGDVYKPIYKFKEEGFPGKFGWGIIERDKFDVWARVWVEGSEPVEDEWILVNNFIEDNICYNNFEADSKYNKVIFVIRDKGTGSGWNPNSQRQTATFDLSKGRVIF